MSTSLTNTPDTSAPVVRPQTIGTVHCINVARLGQPQDLRYYGTSAICGASGNAHTTQAQAEQDIHNWADGKPVGYVQHAVVPLSQMARYAPMFAAGVAATMKMQSHTVVLTTREYRRLLRQRGKLRIRQLYYNTQPTPTAMFWCNWECIRGEWRYMSCGRWQQESVRRAYRQRLEEMRALRLLN